MSGRPITPAAANLMRESLNKQIHMRNWCVETRSEHLEMFRGLSVYAESDGKPARYEIELAPDFIVWECVPGFDVFLDAKLGTYRQIEAADVARCYCRPIPGAEPAVICSGDDAPAIKSINIENAAYSIVVLPARAPT